MADISDEVKLNNEGELIGFEDFWKCAKIVMNPEYN
jgi:hypothetical protein